MSYTLDYVLHLGDTRTGLTDLRAQLVDSTGGSVGAAISTGFVELAAGSGSYLWHATALPDGHRGAVRFYSDAAPGTLLAAAAVNPEEVGMGEALSLLGRHAVVKSMVYTGGNLMSYTVVLYSTAAQAIADDGVTGLLATYSVAHVYDGSNNLIKSTMTRN